MCQQGRTYYSINLGFQSCNLLRNFLINHCLDVTLTCTRTM